jgi:hypothetical protein
MKKIETLLAQLKQKLPNVIETRIEKLKSVLSELEVAKTNFASDPSDENKDLVDSLNDQAVAIEESIEERIEVLLEAESKNPPTPPAPAPENPPTPPAPQEQKKKKGGWFVVTAIAVAVITLGAVTLSNKSK